MGYFTFLLPTLEHLGLFSYWLILLVSFIESLVFVGKFIPGGMFVIFAGFLSAHGYLDIGDLIWFAAIGAILGDGVSYWLGSKGIKYFHEEKRVLKLTHLNRGQQYVRKYGGKSIFFGRFIGPLRPIVPFVAGLFGMDRKKFLLLNILSGFLWAIGYIFLGYFFGSAASLAEAWITRAGLFVLAVLISALVIWWFVKKSRTIFLFVISIAISLRDAVIHNPDVQNIMRRYPSLFAFMAKRFSRDTFFGLPFTLIVFAFIYVTSLFLGVTESIITSGPIVSIDARVVDVLHAFRDAQLITFFTWVTLLGKWQIVVGGVIVAISILWIWGRRFYIIPFLVTLIGSEVFNVVGKLVLRRDRPDVAYYIEQGFSFPSGHATIAVAFYGFLVYILFSEIRRWKYRAIILFWGLIIISGIGLSRLYLGVHYVSDVWGGHLAGLLFLIIGITLIEWIKRRRLAHISRNILPRAKVVSVILLLSLLAYYILFALNYHPLLSNFEVIHKGDGVANALDIFQDKTLSRFSETPLDNKQEPLSFIIVIKDDTALVDVMNSAGWHTADEPSVVSVLTLAKSVLSSEAYQTAPMTPSFWNATLHDFGFEKETATKSVKERHHVRFWKTRFETKEGKRVYVGTASFDSGIKWLITHTISPDIDTEREFLFADLQSTGRISTSSKVTFVEPLLGQNFSGDPFFTDGKLYSITIE
ncbi:MAG: LssY C-terminal domain-containing protein [bacterium]|nr:LssY C-terminal domain-containing protein [bacterium]